MDANGHLRNTAYSEFCTHVRFSFFAEYNFEPRRLKELQIGPIILREEAVFYREIGLMEILKISCQLYQASPDFSTFNWVQFVFKENGKKAAKLTIDAMWLDLTNRKPIVPPEELQALCKKIPRTKDFEFIQGNNFRRLIR